ncbi:hypothetical protein QQS21_011402 [Conoideocrella luteorostrata]|uniref:Uncharacterized protein n=1 Tax=Conoideocrella luteorostrata TaxID=1105319 RepID=A0AAJ0CDA6_9HYPO|nr:hypothetical protein QQS21_011402 [Conoideocrella luteorostrata]
MGRPDQAKSRKPTAYINQISNFSHATFALNQSISMDNQICLDVAIDHRIRRLFQLVPVDSTKPSNHVSCIKSRGRSLGRSEDEIDVTAQLAGPPFQGGIAITLQQPRSDHPFHKGVNAVVDDCKSLKAIADVFSVASNGSLRIGSSFGVVDLLPFISEKVADMSDEKLKKSFQTSTQVICEKAPDVLVCAGRIWTGKFDGRKGDAGKLESIGLGGSFGGKPSLPVMARIHQGDRGFVSVPRVNGFHPSHAMNYHPHASVLRQLLLLVGAEACGRVRDDWKEEDWMDELRMRSQDTSKQLSLSPSKSPSPQSPSKSPGKYSNTRFFSDYQELYSDKLLEIRKQVTALLHSSASEPSLQAGIYDELLDSRLSEKCSDASLILREMARLQHKGWSDKIAWKNEAALKEASADTKSLVEEILRALKGSRATQLAKVISQCATSISGKVKDKRGTKGIYYALDLDGACVDFLSLAKRIETLLLRLLEEKEAADLSRLLTQLKLDITVGVSEVLEPDSED